MRPSIAPLGIGDLKVTKQVLVRYAPGEVAHVENVLAREKRERTHRRLRRVEEIVDLEREREEESRRDLQTTERFELNAEAKRTVQSETKFEAGLELSASYGPVSLGAFARFATNESKEESDTNSTKYAKEVTDKSVSRIVERVREERRTTTMEETEETNTHGFDNTAGNEHVVGVYRWVDKHYRQKVVDYGKRLMYEFVVPEPAAFYLYSHLKNYENNVLPKKPEPPTDPITGEELTSPQQVGPWNYMQWTEQYGASGVEPPPEPFLTVRKGISRELPDVLTFSFGNEELAIPKGYEESFVDVAGKVIRTYPDDLPPEQRQGFAQVTVGNTVFGYNIPSEYALPEPGTTGKVPISVVGGKQADCVFRNFGVNVLVCCTPLAGETQRWQLATFNAIMDAYRKALMDYQEQLAAAEVQHGARLGGSNPEINREVEKEELKRACQVLWAGDGVDLSPAIEQDTGLPTPADYPRIIRDAAARNAEKIEFFEEAFEWENLVYEFYPYYWARPETWVDRAGYQSDDPIFERFLTAGAARVVVPVRPSRTEAVLWYQLTGEVWTGGDIPALPATGDTDVELYNAFIQEMSTVADSVDIDVEVEIPADDPEAWMVRVPTTLVWLQPDGALPDQEPEG